MSFYTSDTPAQKRKVAFLPSSFAVFVAVWLLVCWFGKNGEWWRVVQAEELGCVSKDTGRLSRQDLFWCCHFYCGYFAHPGPVYI